MDNTDLFKKRMSDEEMAEAFFAITQMNVNSNAVGRFAKKNGYKRVKQMENGKYLYYFLRVEL